MALNIYFTPHNGPCSSSVCNNGSLKRQFTIITNCNSSTKSSKLEIGSPIILTEAPKMLKTAASVPCLRANSGLVKAGDVGRIVSRKLKDVWAVRLSVGTYLIDRKYFELLELDD